MGGLATSQQASASVEDATTAMPRVRNATDDISESAGAGHAPASHMRRDAHDGLPLSRRHGLLSLHRRPRLPDKHDVHVASEPRGGHAER